MAITLTLHLARQASPSAQGTLDGASQQGQSGILAGFCACIALMQSLIALSEVALTVAATSMLARACTAAQADVIGTSTSDKAIIIADMVRNGCRVLTPIED